VKKCEKTYQQTVSHIHICRNVMCFHLFPGLGSAITAWNARIFLLQRSATWCSRAHMMRFRPNTTSAEACNPKQITTTNSFSFSMVHGSNVILICITCYPLFSDIHIIYCIILYYIILCYVILYFIISHYIILYYIVLYYISYYIMLYYIMLCYMISYYYILLLSHAIHCFDPHNYITEYTWEVTVAGCWQ
jgi:hypothetical protein